MVDEDRALPDPLEGAGFSPIVTLRRSLSLPTQAKTISAPAAASAGVAALSLPCCATQASARAAVRL